MAGVWVAANVTDLADRVIMAAAAGARAGAAVNMDLVMEGARLALAQAGAVVG